MKQLPFIYIDPLEIVAAITLDLAFGSRQLNTASATNSSSALTTERFIVEFISEQERARIA